MLHLRTGNFITNSGILVHGCNMQGVMAAGAALAVKNAFPRNYQEYKRMCETHKVYLGNVLYHAVNDDTIIANAFTQVQMGRCAQLSAVRSALIDVFESAAKFQQPIHSVKIGCGIGGLDWDNDVFPLYNALAIMFPEVDCTIWSL